MSVEIEGQKGYDYQYLVTLLLILENFQKKNLKVYIEKENSEDSCFIFNEDGIFKTVELQAKKRNKAIKFNEFCKWLCHFDKNSSKKFLLTKLSDKNSALFITNSRCDDITSKFVDKNHNLAPKRNLTFNNDFFKSLPDYFESLEGTETSLSKKRSLTILNFLNQTNNLKRKKLKRIKILENLTENIINIKIDSILNKQFLIPQSSIETLKKLMLDKIRNYKGNNKSVIPDINSLINKYKSDNILNKNHLYFHRKSKKYLSNFLKNSNGLLLAGVPFCGKTYLAKDLAQDYLEKGYKIEISNNINEAITFLNKITKEDRLFILEDPFGAIDLKKDSLDILRKLKNILNDSIKNSKKIIVTSRTDIILNLNKENSLKKCNIKNFQWNDLTENKYDEILKLWTLYYGDSKKSTQILKNIYSNLILKEKSFTLQLGEINNIYNSYKSINEFKNYNIKELINIARINSKEISSKIDNFEDDFSNILILLSLTCNTFRSITINEFKNIINNNTLNLTITNKDMKSYPKYNKENDLNINKIRIFLELGYIRIDELEKITFVHPIYYHAVKLLIKKRISSPFFKEKIIFFIKQCLNSLNVSSNLCCLEMIQDIYLDNNNNNIENLMFQHLDSIYPVIRDRIILFFSKKFNFLNEEKQKKIIESIIYDYTDIIKWEKNIPWINNTYSTFNIIDIPLYFKSYLTTEGKEVIINNFLNNEIISSKEMWNLLNSLPFKQELEIANFSLTYEESFIRELGIYFIFSNYAFKLESIDKYLIIDEHYNYILKLIEGAFNSWIHYEEKFKKQILVYLKKCLKNILVYIKINIFLENFYKNYLDPHTNNLNQKKTEELWNAWYEIFIYFLENIPEKFIILYQPRILHCIEESTQFINKKFQIITLATKWFNWIEKNEKFRLTDDYGMSVANYLIKETKYDFNCRKDLLKKMLAVKNTSFLTSTLYHLIRNFQYLDKSEIEKLIFLISSNRKDNKWIKAILLQNNYINDDIFKAIFNIENENLYNNIEIFTNILISSNLLNSCLKIYTGNPQPLWFNGYHHQNSEKWNLIILEILKRETLDENFDICLNEFMDSLYNFDSSFEDSFNFYNTILLKNIEKRRKSFQVLLKISITQNQRNKKVWNSLFSNSSKFEMIYYFKKIIENIEPIESNSDNLFELFQENIILKVIYPKLENDYFILNFFHQITNNLITKKAILIAEEKIIDLYKNKTIQLNFTSRFIHLLIKKQLIFINNKNEINNLIEINRKNLIQIASKKSKLFEDHLKIDSWLY